MSDNRNIRNSYREKYNDERWMVEQNRNPRAKSKDVGYAIRSSELEGKDKRKMRLNKNRNSLYMNNSYGEEERSSNYPENDIFETEVQKLEQATDGEFKKLEDDNIENQERKDNKEKGKVNKNFSMALELMRVYHFKIFDDQLYVYDEKGYWELIPETDANRKLRSMIPDIYCDCVTKNTLREIYEWIRVEAIPMECDKEVRKKYLNFKNCIMDWQTGKILEHTSEYNLRYQLQVEYIKNDEKEDKGDSFFYGFVTDVFGDDYETIREFAKFLGLCLSDIRWLKLCFFFIWAIKYREVSFFKSSKASNW